MFVGRPPGNYDRLLDFSRAVTGNLFFVPSATFWIRADDRAGGCGASRRAGSGRTVHSHTPEPDGSLGIGSLKGEN